MSSIILPPVVTLVGNTTITMFVSSWDGWNRIKRSKSLGHAMKGLILVCSFDLTPDQKRKMAKTAMRTAGWCLISC